MTTYDACTFPTLGRQELDVLGRALRARLSPAELATCAGDLLQVASSAFVDIPAPITKVVEMAERPEQWHRAHSAFREVRSLTLLAEKGGLDRAMAALLHVAELVAKLQYNASGSSAPFDEDTGQWIPVCLQFLCQQLPAGEIRAALPHMLMRHLPVHDPQRQTPDLERFSYAHLAQAGDGRDRLVSELASALSTSLRLAIDFHRAAYQLMNALKAVGHELASFDESLDFQDWTPDRTRHRGPGLFITLREPDRVHIVWAAPRP